jgi:hypothetical protein
MSRLAGAQLERPPGKKYASALRFAEIRPPLPVPRAGTLARWRDDLADDFELALEAPLGTFRGAAGELRIDEGVMDRVAWLRDALVALRAFALVVRTSADITPSRRDRDRLSACLDLLRIEGVTIVWEARGLWEPEEFAVRALELNTVPAFDPLSTPAPVGGPFHYARVPTVGQRARISEGLLYEIDQALAESERAYVAIESSQSFRRATELQALFDA